MRTRACVAEGEGEDDTGRDSESETWEDKGNGLEEERGGVQEEAGRGGQEGERNRWRRGRGASTRSSCREGC